nr:unnamed protein product [Spirometra erinaceieuropaei]
MQAKTFAADTRMLLDIVAKSLYSDKEVFIRELISNASDAVERLKFLQTSGAAVPGQGPLEIHVQTFEEKRLLVIQDNGIGMTAEEMETNLGTIAKSGSREYVSRMKADPKSATDSANIIGRFGVGFYAAFMVADEVEVFSRSQSSPESYATGGHVWNSKGITGTFEIGKADNVSPGTKIVLHLKEDAADFCKEPVVQSIIRKYSNFIGVPVYLNGKQLNVVEPLWCKDPSKVSEEEYTSFYQFLSGNAFDVPRYRTTFQTDSPINLRALLFVPSMKPTIFDLAKDGEVGVSLYSRKYLYKLSSSDSPEDKVLATALIDCLLDNAMAHAGLLEEVSSGDFPHLLFYGPPGSGKKTRITCLLRELYGPGVDKLRIEHHSFLTPSKKKIELSTASSNYHLEVNPSDVGIYDRIVIQELIKNMASTAQLESVHQREFKVVVIHEVDRLTRDAQHSLRRTMEKYMQTCRLILCAESLSKHFLH